MTAKAGALPSAELGIQAVWLPVLVGALLCTLVLVLWRTLEEQERKNLRGKVEVEAEYLADQIKADLRNRLPSLQRMARRWGGRRDAPKEELIGEVRSYVSDVPGFQALQWVDEDFIVRWVVPLEGNEKALNLNLSFERNRRVAMEKARDSRAPAVTMPIDLVQGGKGFLAFFPIHTGGEFEGFILATFRIQEWLDYVFNTKNRKVSSDECRTAVFFDGIPVYKQAGWDNRQKHLFTAMEQIPIMDHTLYIYVRPTGAFIKSGKTLLPTLTAVFGILLSMLVSLVVRMYQKTYSETWKTHVAKAAQEAESLERRKVERELHRALARMDLATKAGQMGVSTWELSTGKLTWNDRMFDLFGIPHDVAPTYEIWRKAVHPEDLPQTEILLDNVVQGKAVFDTEYRIVFPDGTVRHIRAAARVETDHEGTPQYVTGLSWDVTGQRQEEAALKKREEQVRLLLNSMGEAIYGIDLHGNCTFANPSCAKMLGYPDVQMLLGKNMHNLIHHSYPGGRPMAVEDCKIYRAFREGRGEHVDDEVLWRADGTWFPAEYWSYPQIADCKVDGAVVTFVDITERKKAESLLATERQRLLNILEGTNVGTWEWNIQTGETTFNERWAAIIGYRLSELAPVSIATWGKVVHPDDLKVSGDLLEKHFKGELAYYECELRMRHKDGSWVWVLDRGKVITWTDDGKPLVMSGTHQDISVRKQAEKEREALIANLEKAISDVKKLSGMLPICASCKKIRDDKGYWKQIESYIKEHSEAEFSHGLCPECAKKWYPELFSGEGSFRV